MESYNKSIENSVYNYQNYPNQAYMNTTNDLIGSNYYFPNNQYFYNNYYGNYYQPQFNAANYGQYAYYPNYNFTIVNDDSANGSALALSSTPVNDKIDTTINTSSNENSAASSASSTSIDNDYVSANSSISPIPSMNKLNDQSTPIISTSSVGQNVHYPTPPTDLSDNECNKEKKLSNFEKSPEVVPHDESNDDEQNEELQSQSRMKRRTRTQFSKYQIDCLENVFVKNHYPDVQTVDLLAEKLGLAIERISVWFQNRRAKFKKTKKPSNFSAERLYSDDRNVSGRSVSLCKKDPVAFQTFANHLAPKPSYSVNGIQYQNQTWPNFNANLISDRFKN